MMCVILQFEEIRKDFAVISKQGESRSLLRSIEEQQCERVVDGEVTDQIAPS
jgi:hypothetical protein